MRREYKKILKETKQKFIKAIVEKLDSFHGDDPKSFWKTIDILRKGVQIQNNPISLSPSTLYMQKLYNETNANIDLSQLEKENVNNKDLDYAFVCKEIRDLIKRLKKNKQPGIDLIKLCPPNEYCVCSVSY
jgi:hypothetical protein